MADFRLSAERVNFENWCSLLTHLGGSLDTKDVNVIEIIHEIRKQPKGTQEILLKYMRLDTMSCTNYDVAKAYHNLVQDLYIKEAKSQRMYKFNTPKGIWEEPRNLKGDFIDIMTLYMQVLDQGGINRHLFPDDKDKEYAAKKAKYQNYIKQDSTINAILNIFKSIVVSVDTLFDLEPEYNHVINFRNGIYNLDTQTFRPRQLSDMFTKALDFDYHSEYCKVCYDEIHDFFKKIQPDEEQRHFTTSYLKYCLQGGNPECIFKMNIGYSASNGKSSEMQIHNMVFPIYTYKLDKTTFNKMCSKRHKYMHALVTSPVRLAYISELDDSKLDEDFLKDVVDCKKLELEKMFSTMTEESIIQCKIITTSNKDPNIDIDPGILRRLTIQHYDSRFVTAKEVDEANHLYLDDKTWTESRFVKDEYKLAYFHYLLLSPPLVVPKANRNLVKDIIEENDTVYSVLTDRFEVTKCLHDKVPQGHVIQLFPDILKQRLNRDLKRFGVIYDKTSSVNGVKKVYRGLKALEQGETPD